MNPPLTVDAHEVEHGDRLFGMITPVDQLLTDGIWWYYGADGVVIAKRRCGTRVQVVRDSPAVRPVGDSGRVELSSGDSPTANSDDCPPHGIARVRGLWMVTP